MWTGATSVHILKGKVIAPFSFLHYGMKTSSCTVVTLFHNEYKNTHENAIKLEYRMYNYFNFANYLYRERP